MRERLLRLAFDVDGVFANFVQGFLSLINQYYGIEILSSEWRDYDCFGEGKLLTKEQWDKGWQLVKNTPCFWSVLQPYSNIPFTDINCSMMNFQFNGYFITRRMDLSTGPITDANALTRIWLENNGITESSAIIAVPHADRAGMLKLVGADAYIEDWGEQFLKCQDAGIKSYLLDRPYNQYIDTPYRVYSIEQFIDRALGKIPDVISALVYTSETGIPDWGASRMERALASTTS